MNWTDHLNTRVSHSIEGVDELLYPRMDVTDARQLQMLMSRQNSRSIGGRRCVIHRQDTAI